MAETKAASGKGSPLWIQVSSAIFGTLVAWLVILWVGGLFYQPQQLAQPAYIIQIPGVAAMGLEVDLATLRRRWPASLEKPLNQPNLLAYMSEIGDRSNAAIIERPEATTAEPAVELPLPVLLASADVAKGARVAKKCLPCHSFEQGGRNGVGPNLWDVVGGSRAQRTGYKYSNAMNEFGGEWSFDSLFNYLLNPKQYLKGTNMAFAGVKKSQDRANLLAYMRTMSDRPVNLPSAQ